MRWPSKLRLASTAVIAGLAICAGTAAQAGTFNDPKDLAAIAAIEQALATQTDMTKLIDYYAPHTVVMDMIYPGIYNGRAEVQKSFTAQFAGVKSMQGKVLDSSMISDGTLACAATRASFNTVLKNGTALQLSTRQLDAFRKINGKWYIIQEQISVPMDPKTGMAVMNADIPVRGPVTFTADQLPGPAIGHAQAVADIKQWVITGSPIVDVHKMVTLFGPTDNILLYDITTPGEYRSHQEIVTAYAPLMDQLSSASVVVPIFTADSDGKMAAQIDTQNLTINFKNGTSKVIYYRQSDCMSHTSHGYLTFMEMLSVPVDPKTGKSVATPQ